MRDHFNSRPAEQLELEKLSLTYQEVGQTAAPLPGGFHHTHVSRSVGQGFDIFEVMSQRLLAWQMHERAGRTVRASSGDIRVGSLVVLGIGIGPVKLSAPCRVVYVINEPGRRGFAYGTLPGHPETGEQAFTVGLTANREVIATIMGFSRPASFLARLGGPITLHLQERAARAYLDAMTH